MYEHTSRQNTYAWITETPSSNKIIPKNKPKGISVKKNTIILLVNILNKKLDNIANKAWPAVILLNSRTPREIALEQYDANSIKTNNGTKGKGQPSGTKVPKKLNLWIDIANIVKPKKIITLKPNVSIADVVMAKLYTIFPTKLEIKIKKNNEYIKGKNISWLEPIWLFTIDKTVTYILSKKIDHFEGISEFSLLLKECKPIIINKIIREYKPKLVKEICKFPIKAEENPKRLTTSNWSKGEWMNIII